MRRAKTIDQLYDEVKDYDLVITTDAALATALNARIDRPFIGNFAHTPRELASVHCLEILGKPIISDLKLLSIICDETGLDFRFVHGEVQNIREIRKYTVRVREHLSTRSAKAVYDSFASLPTLERAMECLDNENFSVFKASDRIAAIEVDLFDDLDKHVLPWDYDEFSIFLDEEVDIDTIHEIGNDREIAENAVDLIDPSCPSDYALIINASSPMADAVRSALYRRDLPFINSLNVRDLAQVRDYLQFVTLALDFETLRVRNVRELFSNYNGLFKRGTDGYLLNRQTESDMSAHAWKLFQVMKEIYSLTFDEVRNEICDKRARIQVGIVIEDLGIADKKVTPALVSEMAYAVDNVTDLHHNEQIPENEKTGVLIADCTKSVYVDRPVVFFLGMEQDWNMNIAGKKYLDAVEEVDKNVNRMSALLQQGSARMYFVNTTRGGRPARPSTLFDKVFGKTVDKFSDMCSNLVRGKWFTPKQEVMPAHGEASVGDAVDEPFSKTSFNNYYKCPRAYMFGKLLSTDAKDVMEMGTLVHNFAELYLTHPDKVEEVGLDYIVGLTESRYSGLSSPMMSEVDKAKIKRLMANIMDYLQSKGISDPELDKLNSSRSHPNPLMTALGVDECSSSCEIDFDSREYPVHGQFDLYWDGIITDYKTGSPHNSKDLVKSMMLEGGQKYPEFQPIIYLGLARENGTGKGKFVQFYPMENDVVSTGDGFDVLQSVRTFQLADCSLRECMLNSEDLVKVLETTLSKPLKPYAAPFMRAVVETGSDDPGTWRGDEAVVSAGLAVTGMSNCKSNRETVERGIKKITDQIMNGMLITDNTVEIPVEGVDKFFEILSKMHRKAVEQSLTDFPAMPRVKCDECDYRQVCTRSVIAFDPQEDGFYD